MCEIDHVSEVEMWLPQFYGNLMTCIRLSSLYVQGGSAGSESGGSGVDSITGEHNVSGRSSAYGDNMQEPLVGARSETSSVGAPAGFQVCIKIR
jgi:hypothetical protein